MSPLRIRTLLADAGSLESVGAAALLEQSGCAVVARVATPKAALHALRERGPFGLAILGIQEWPEVLSRVHAEHPGVPVLILSGLREDEMAPLAFRQGAAGFVSRQCAERELPEAVRAVARGERYVTPTLALAMADALSKRRPLGHATAPLSTRETQVARLLARGFRRREIAEHIAVAPATVTTYRRRVLDKLRLHTNVDLVRWALRHGLVDDEPLAPPAAGEPPEDDELRT